MHVYVHAHAYARVCVKSTPHVHAGVMTAVMPRYLGAHGAGAYTRVRTRAAAEHVHTRARAHDPMAHARAPSRAPHMSTAPAGGRRDCVPPARAAMLDGHETLWRRGDGHACTIASARWHVRTEIVCIRMRTHMYGHDTLTGYARKTGGPLVLRVATCPETSRPWRAPAAHEPSRCAQ